MVNISRQLAHPESEAGQIFGQKLERKIMIENKSNLTCWFSCPQLVGRWIAVFLFGLFVLRPTPLPYRRWSVFVLRSQSTRELRFIADQIWTTPKLFIFIFVKNCREVVKKPWNPFAIWWDNPIQRPQICLMASDSAESLNSFPFNWIIFFCQTLLRSADQTQKRKVGWIGRRLRKLDA
jgi:hypothetical protein